jgi:hypothetical protein
MKPNDLLKFHKDFTSEFSKELEKLNIGILSDFCNNKEVMLEFYHRYIEPNEPKIVLCGINPGKCGAGQTGVPFFDFNSLSKILPNIKRNDTEKSAQFMYSIIEHFGVDDFFKNFYLSNISCIGFYNLRTGKNINYYELPLRIQLFLVDNFSKNMRSIKPKIIIPLSEAVEKNLKMDLSHEQKITVEIGNRLSHPSTKYAKKDDYIERLKQYLNKVRSNV